MKTTEMQLALRVREGKERECALELRGAATEAQWKVIVRLAAECLQVHESAALGSAVVVVSGSDQAERVLRDLNRDQPAPVPKV